MGLNDAILRLIVRGHADQPWRGPVLTLGVQDLVSNYQGLTKIFEQERVPYRSLAPAERIPSTAHYFRSALRDAKNYAHPRDFFRMLGIDEYDDLDFADFEKPSLIHDMNRPIPDDWRGKYRMIVDGGTIEHVFDVRAVFENIVSFLDVGGDVLHVAPMSGWVNHGFYQLNPCLFYDVYQSNGFEVRSAHLAHAPKDSTRHPEMVRPFEYTENMIDVSEDAYRLLFVFRATKRRAQAFRTPVQGCYRQFLTDDRGRKAI